jgi:osmoprotectant transport system ATP-binding protein
VTTPSPPNGIVTFDAVSFRYPGRPPVMSNVSFSIAPGEVLALVGRSGTGKSTLLKLINRLLTPDSGTVRVEGRDTREWDGIRLRRRVGYVLQDVGLFPHMTVEQNVSLIPRLERWAAERMRARTHALLELVGLPPVTYASRMPRELSGGQRQRVGVARALAVDPKILLMDEPFGALDPVTRSELRREFSRIQQELGTAVVLVTHDMAEAFALGARVGVLDDGDLVVCDTPEVVAASTDPRVRVFVDTLVQAPVSRRPELSPGSIRP